MVSAVFHLIRQLCRKQYHLRSRYSAQDASSSIPNEENTPHSCSLCLTTKKDSS